MKKFDIAILGATCYGISYAASCKASCILIDKQISVGSEFVYSYKYAKADMNLKSENLNRIIGSMKTRKLIDENGNYHLLPLRGIISEFVLEKNLNIMFDTRIVKIEKENDLFCITLVNNNGISKIYAEKILDTTSRRYDGAYTANKKLAAIISDGNSELSDSENIHFEKCMFEDDYIMYYDADENDTLQTASEKLIKAFSSLYEGKYHIASIARAFLYEYKSPVNDSDNGYVFHPSEQYINFAEAIKEGENASKTDN